MAPHPVNPLTSEPTLPVAPRGGRVGAYIRVSRAARLTVGGDEEVRGGAARPREAADLARYLQEGVGGSSSSAALARCSEAELARCVQPSGLRIR